MWPISRRGYGGAVAGAVEPVLNGIALSSMVASPRGAGEAAQPFDYQSRCIDGNNGRP
jgi:hypothetical protein